jgi:hypothetical protein
LLYLLKSALNSALALASYNITQSNIYSPIECATEINQSWESWIEDNSVEEEIYELDAEIVTIEEELATLKNSIKSSSLLIHSCLYTPQITLVSPPSATTMYSNVPIKRKVEIEDIVSEEETAEVEYSDSEREEDSSDSSDDDLLSDSESDASSDDSYSEDDSTIYIPYKRRKRTTFYQNRVKLIKADEEDCEEDVDILN